MRTTGTLIRLPADLSLRWVHMSEGTFSHVAANLLPNGHMTLN